MDVLTASQAILLFLVARKLMFWPRLKRYCCFWLLGNSCFDSVSSDIAVLGCSGIDVLTVSQVILLFLVARKLMF